MVTLALGLDKRSRFVSMATQGRGHRRRFSGGSGTPIRSI